MRFYSGIPANYAVWDARAGRMLEFAGGTCETGDPRTIALLMGLGLRHDPVEEIPEPPTEETAPEPESAPPIEPTAMTRKELMAELKARGIRYRATDSTAHLIETLRGR